MYTVTTYYYDEQPIIDEYPNIDEAMEAYAETDWRACHAPRDVAGDMRRIVVKHGDKVLRSRSYP
jgi:hypothetical protein